MRLLFLLGQGPGVDPPVKIEVEQGRGATNLEELKKEIETLLNSRLNFRASVHLVPEGSLPRYEMKAQLIKKLWESKPCCCIKFGGQIRQTFGYQGTTLKSMSSAGLIKW